MKNIQKRYEAPVADVVLFSNADITYTTESGAGVGGERIPFGEGGLEDGEEIS